MPDFYGTAAPDDTLSETERIAELVRLRGFAVLADVLSAEKVREYCARLDAVYTLQEAEFGEALLASIGESNLVRLPLAYDLAFVDLLRIRRVLEVVRELVGSYVVLHLQNGIIVRPSRRHHQAAWHRDLPYQEFVSSRPLSVNAFFCLEEFSNRTGGTVFLPFSHRSEKIPGSTSIEALQEQPRVAAGSVIIFDSMVFHRAGDNTSKLVRRGINHVFTTGILRQQIDIPRWLPVQNPELHSGAEGDAELRILLGYETQTAESVNAYRQRRLARVEDAV